MTKQEAKSLLELGKLGLKIKGDKPYVFTTGNDGFTCELKPGITYKVDSINHRRKLIFVYCDDYNVVCFNVMEKDEFELVEMQEKVKKFF